MELIRFLITRTKEFYFSFWVPIQLSSMSSIDLCSSSSVLLWPLISSYDSTDLCFLTSSACKRPRGLEDQLDAASDHPHGRHPHARPQVASCRRPDPGLRVPSRQQRLCRPGLLRQIAGLYFHQHTAAIKPQKASHSATASRGFPLNPLSPDDVQGCSD